MKKRIIVVDDEPDHLFSVKQVLEGKDNKFEVICASSGLQCLELLKNDEIPDLILLDIMMPKMDGWTLNKQIKSNPLWKNIPIIFLSAKSDGMEKISEDFLVVDIIKKPYDIEELQRRIDTVFKDK
jgi:putative two-component system response regulator